MAAMLDSQATFKERLNQLGVEEALVQELNAKGLTTYGSLAFAVSTTPQQITDAVLDAWLSQDDASRRETNQAKEHEKKLEGIIFSPEVTPSHALVDACVHMLEQSVLTWIKPEDCTSRAQEIQSLKKDSKVALDSDGSIKVSSKAAALSWKIEKWVQHLFLSHERSQSPDFASVTLQQIIECDKQMFIQASNSLVRNLQSEPGAQETPLDKELRTLRTSPELMPYLMPMQTKAAVKPSPNPNQPTKRPQENGKGNPNKYRKGKGKGKGAGKGKSKSGGLDLPPGCVAKTPDGKPLCFAFNRGICGYKGTGPRCQWGFHLSLLDKGFSVLAVDYVMHNPAAPVTFLDLTSSSDQSILEDIMHSDTKLLQFWDSFTEVFFHNCCHGGQRRKGTRWKSSPGLFSALEATCQHDHEHLPYQVLPSDAGWTFDTSMGAAYPKLLTDRVATLVQQALQSKGYSFIAPINPRINTLAIQHRQHRKRQQLIPEYKQVTWLEPGTLLTEWQHPIPSSQRGKAKEGEDVHLERDQILVGTWHTPEEFVEKALKATHPMEDTAVSRVTLEAIQFVVENDPRLVEIERKKNLLKAKIRAKQLEVREQELHRSLATSVQKVVQGKKLLLWKHLLGESAYDDMEVISFMMEGFPVGAHDHPEVYPLKIKPAVLTEAELRDNAEYSRKALIGRRPQTEEPGFAEHLMETAKEEKELNFLDGPFSSEEEVSSYLGHSNWGVIRRFVIHTSSSQSCRLTETWLLYTSRMSLADQCPNGGADYSGCSCWKVPVDTQGTVIVLDGIWALGEEQAYAYVRELRELNASRTKPSRFLEAVTFAFHMLGADVDNAMYSPRVRGAVTVPVVVPTKKTPLTMAQVSFLERLAMEDSGQLGIFAGYTCMVLHMRLRWMDAQFCQHEPFLDMCGAQGFLECQLYHHKNAGRQKHAQRLLSAGGWSMLPLDAAQATSWLRELLRDLQPSVPMHTIGTHSLKATILSLMAKAGCGTDLRRLAGYHVDPGARMALEYSRDAQTPVLHAIQAIGMALQHEDDALLVEWEHVEPPPSEPVDDLFGEADSISSLSDPGDRPVFQGLDCSTSDEERDAEVAGPIVGDALARDLEPEIHVRVFKHVISGCCHVAKHSDIDPDDGDAVVLKCGKLASKNFQEVELAGNFLPYKCSRCFAGE
eukprot:s739_g22.t1